RRSDSAAPRSQIPDEYPGDRRRSAHRGTDHSTHLTSRRALLLTAVAGGASVDGGARIVWGKARGGSPWLTDQRVFTGSAVCGAAARLGSARIEVPNRHEGCAGARAGRRAPGRAGFHLAVRVGVHEHQPAVRRATAGQLAVEGELAR